MSHAAAFARAKLAAARQILADLQQDLVALLVSERDERARAAMQSTEPTSDDSRCDPTRLARARQLHAEIADANAVLADATDDARPAPVVVKMPAKREQRRIDWTAKVRDMQAAGARPTMRVGDADVDLIDLAAALRGLS